MPMPPPRGGEPPGGFRGQTQVRNLKGRTITVDVAANEPVVSVMAKIAEKEQIPIAFQRLIYAGKQLDPQMVLSSYEIERDATLSLAPRLIASLRMRPL